MAKREEAAAAVRKALEDRGLALHVTTERAGDVLTAGVELENLTDERPLVKLVAAGRLEDLDLTVGLDVSETAFWNLLLRVLDLWDGVRVEAAAEEEPEG